MKKIKEDKNKKLKSENKKGGSKVVWMVSGVGILTTSFLIFFFLTKPTSKRIVIEKGQPIQKMEVEEREEKIDSLLKESNKKLEEQKLEEYNNEAFGYQIEFPENWYAEDGDANNDLEEKEMSDGSKVLVGGHNFWSNYKSINNYTPENRPDDFLLLALTICKTKDKDATFLAKEFGLFEKGETRETVFKTEEIEGVKFVEGKLGDEKFHEMVVFRKDELFYIFNLTFSGGESGVIELMEKMVGTFELGKN